MGNQRIIGLGPRWLIDWYMWIISGLELPIYGFSVWKKGILLGFVLNATSLYVVLKESLQSALEGDYWKKYLCG